MATETQILKVCVFFVNLFLSEIEILIATTHTVVSILIQMHRPEYTRHHEEEKNKTNSQNSIYYCERRLLVLRTMDFGMGLDITASRYGSGTSQ